MTVHDYDTCIYCAASGCAMGVAEHAEDCPSSTGLWPVTEEMFKPRCCECGAPAHGAPGCCECGVAFALGDHYVHRRVAEDGYEVLCVGCGAFAEVAP